MLRPIFSPALILICQLLLPTALEAQCECGDVNQDGNIDLLDALSAAQIGAGLFAASPGQRLCGNVDGVGQITPLDVLLLAQLVVGLDVQLRCGPTAALVLYEACSDTFTLAERAREQMVASLTLLDLTAHSEVVLPPNLDEYRFVIDMRFTTPITGAEENRWLSYLRSDTHAAWFVAGALTHRSSRGMDIERLLNRAGVTPPVVIEADSSPFGESSTVSISDPHLMAIGPGTPFPGSNPGWYIADPGGGSPLATDDSVAPARVRAVFVPPSPARRGKVIVTFFCNRCFGQVGSTPPACPATESTLSPIVHCLISY